MSAPKPTTICTCDHQGLQPGAPKNHRPDCAIHAPQRTDCHIQ